MHSDVRCVSGLDVYGVLHHLRSVHAPCYDGSETPFLLHLIALLWCVAMRCVGTGNVLCVLLASDSSIDKCRPSSCVSKT